MPPTTSALRLSLAGIAALARVKRPVVSVWRARFQTSEDPFPQPIASGNAENAENGQEFFDAREVAEWLVRTRHGNNPDAIADAAAFASLTGVAPSGSHGFESLTALIALRQAHGAPLADLDADALRDLADETDPDDDCLMSEIERLGDALPAYARFVDVLVDGAYSPGAAFESAMAGRFRDGRRDLARVSLAPAAVSLVAHTALELAATNPARQASGVLQFVDPTGCSSDLLVGLVAAAGEGEDITIATANEQTDASRLLRRRLMARGVLPRVVSVKQPDDATLSGPLVNMAQYPSPADPHQSPRDILSAIDRVAVQMDDEQRAVVIAPAGVLCDGPLPADAAELRQRVVRSGRVRAIVRLPAGLLTSSPRRSLALWVLGPGHAAVALGERWTMVADLSEHGLSEASAGDLVSDLVAAMGGKAAVRAHAFRFARFVLTSALLARRGSLVARRQPVRHGIPAGNPDASRGSAALHSAAPHSAALNAVGLSASALNPSGADAIVRAEHLLEQLGGSPLGHVTIAEEHTRTNSGLPVTSLGDLAAEGHLRVRAGTRLDAADIGAGDGFTVIGAPELRGETQPGERTIDRMTFVERHPSARLTDAGDVVFCTAPAPAAWVDREGSSVVAYPARVLRINPDDPAGLLADLVASAVHDAPRHSRDWRRWRVRRVLTDQRAELEHALAALRAERERTQRRLADLNDIEDLVTRSVTGGTMTLSTHT